MASPAPARLSRGARMQLAAQAAAALQPSAEQEEPAAEPAAPMEQRTPSRRRIQDGGIDAEPISTMVLPPQSPAQAGAPSSPAGVSLPADLAPELKQLASVYGARSAPARTLAGPHTLMQRGLNFRARPGHCRGSAHRALAAQAPQREDHVPEPHHGGGAPHGPQLQGGRLLRERASAAQRFRQPNAAAARLRLQVLHLQQIKHLFPAAFEWQYIRAPSLLDATK